jgi:hypothetical protein
MAMLWHLPACPLQWKHMLVSHWLAMDSFIAICCLGNVITDSLLSNGCPLWLNHSGFQVVLAEPLPSIAHIHHNIK